MARLVPRPFSDSSKQGTDAVFLDRTARRRSGAGELLGGSSPPDFLRAFTRYLFLFVGRRWTRGRDQPF